jgi:hypothetical protein
VSPVDCLVDFDEDWGDQREADDQCPLGSGEWVTLAQSPATLEQPPPPTSTTVPNPPGADNEVRPNAVRELIEPPCDDEAMCAAGFYLDGVFFGLDCTAIRTSAVTAEVLGAGTVFGQQVTANVIADIDSSTVVAVSLPGGGACYEEEPSSPWSLAIRQGASQDTIRDAVAHYAPERRLANGWPIFRFASRRSWVRFPSSPPEKPLVAELPGAFSCSGWGSSI